MHDQGIVHGDLKGVRARITTTLLHPSLPDPQGRHPDRQQRQRSSSRLQSSHDNLGPANLYFLVHRGRHNSVDEPRAPRPRNVWFEDVSANEGIGLLCARDGDLRSPQWADAVHLAYGPRRYLEGPERRTPQETARERWGTLHRQCMEGSGTLLEASAVRPYQCRRCTSGTSKESVPAEAIL